MSNFMRKMPRTLIQLHYHNRSGGVRRVIDSYAEAFLRAVPDGQCLLVCAAEPGFESGQLYEIKNVYRCGYRKFSTQSGFLNTRDALVNDLKNILGSKDLKLPVAVIGHNLNIGKNCALSSAFALMAKNLSANNDFRFYAVVHDFTEEGRVDLAKQIDRLTQWEPNFSECLYPVRAIYATPGYESKKILSQAGVAAHWIPNEIAVQSNLNHIKIPARKRVIEFLSDSSGIELKRYRPLFCYPCRIIPRKNVFEAILVACVLLQGNLLLGVRGRSRQDMILYQRIKNFCSRHSLPVIFDNGAVAWNDLLHTDIDMAIAHYLVSDAVLSTSVSEGFGYILHEPWVYSRMVIGRNPGGILPVIDRHHLYKRLPIPLDWIDVSKLCRYVTEHYAQFFNIARGSVQQKEILSKFVRKEMVDFSSLNDRMQENFLDSLLSNTGRLQCLISYLREKKEGWPGLNVIGGKDNLQIEKNRKVVMNSLNQPRFEKLFVKMLQSGSTGRANSVKSHILSYFNDLRRFHPQLAK